MTLSNTTRVLLAAGSLALCITFFVPLWQILLWAPQYPEGLTMKIWYNRLSGEVDIINGLNHYIGMKHISVEMFPEFGFIGLLIGLLIAVGLAAAIFRSAKTLFFFTLLSYVYGVVALWDFWRWGYEYGHNLDPNAAIKVQDMSYQPPLIGYKNLLNFTAYSGPDTGAWVIIVVCLLATVLWWWEFFRHRKKRQQAGAFASKIRMAAPMLLFAMLCACSSGPEPIRYGQDNCTHCKMTLTDKRFGAEILTQKGRVFKFDDLNCVAAYLREGGIPEKDVAQVLTIDFNKTGSFVNVQNAVLLQNEVIKSPMRADIASFSNKSELEAVRAKIGGGSTLNWEAVKKTFQQ
jgi:copper chaperone NosL